jgi:hypothetical protein
MKRVPPPLICGWFILGSLSSFSSTSNLFPLVRLGLPCFESNTTGVITLLALELALEMLSSFFSDPSAVLLPVTLLDIAFFTLVLTFSTSYPSAVLKFLRCYASASEPESSAPLSIASFFFLMCFSSLASLSS